VTALSKNARAAGFLYILASAIGVVRLLYIPSALIVSGNASATADNLVAHESLFRLGIVCYLVGGAVWLFVPLALYRLLKGVDQTLAVLMVILGSLMQVPTYFFNTVTDVAALMFASGADFLAVFDKPQREAFALLSLKLHHQLDLANMMFAGLWLLPFGLLVYRSRFLPRVLGIWLIAACFPYVALSISGFLVPGSEDKIFTLGQPLMWGELATMLWLVIIGAREPRMAPVVVPG
jgi:hypothetical protein